MSQWLPLCALLLLMSFVSAPAGVDPDAYLKWCRDNKQQLSRKQVPGAVSYEATFIPQDLSLIKQSKNSTLTKETVADHRSASKGRMSFLLSVSVPEMGSQEFLLYAPNGKTYDEKLTYYAFGMQQDIVLVVDGRDSVPCTDYIFERSFSRNGNFTLGFAVPNHYKTLSLVVDDKAFDQQDLVFTYTRKDLESLPKLKKYTKWN
jgi:hypothetical protein